MNKRGQFFLIAAIIIVAVVIGLASVVNSGGSVRDTERFFQRTEEIKEEGNHVLDYGTYHKSDTIGLTSSFLESYAEHISQDRVLFIFGNAQELRGLRYDSQSIGSVGIATGGIPNTIDIGGIVESLATVTENEGTVSVEIDGYVYDFKLKKGQNFFFVLLNDEDGETLVAAE